MGLRAKAVVNILEKQYGVSGKKITPIGIGSVAPLANNVNEQGRKENRRVELVRGS